MASELCLMDSRIKEGNANATKNNFNLNDSFRSECRRPVACG
jgi:hypothetical protein